VVERGDGERIATRTLLWTAGTSSKPLLGHLPCEKNRARLIVDDTLAVKDWPATAQLAAGAPIRSKQRRTLPIDLAMSPRQSKV
jgi:hypothetical protein